MPERCQKTHRSLTYASPLLRLWDPVPLPRASYQFKKLVSGIFDIKVFMDALDRLIHFSHSLECLSEFSSCHKYNTAIKREIAHHKYCQWSPRLHLYRCNPIKWVHSNLIDDIASKNAVDTGWVILMLDIKFVRGDMTSTGPIGLYLKHHYGSMSARSMRVNLDWNIGFVNLTVQRCVSDKTRAMKHLWRKWQLVSWHKGTWIFLKVEDWSNVGHCSISMDKTLQPKSLEGICLFLDYRDWSVIKVFVS